MGEWLKERSGAVIACLLAGAVWAVYWQVSGFGLVMYDDHQYVNGRVLAGLSLDTIRWAFTTSDAANWFPLTWLGYLLTSTIFGADPGSFHLVNVCFHSVNAVLLFLLLHRLTGARFRSGFVAALFALHPLRVESVAWVAEFKDVLSGFFWLLTMLLYCRYSARPTLRRYLPVFLSFVCGLMAKPMLVTLPLILLLADVWPLRRLAGTPPGSAVPYSFPRLVLEKLPFLPLMAASAAITLAVQEKGGALNELDRGSFAFNAVNAGIAYLRYLGKMAWPADLAVFYPIDMSLGLWQGGAAFLVLAAVTLISWWQRHKRPWLLFGWLWYLIALVPVIGFVRVGLQAYADRYTYVPSIGIAVNVAWGASEAAASLRCRNLLVGAACAAIALLGVASSLQLRHWENDFTLFEQALRVTERNWLAHNNLATALVAAGRLDEAICHLDEALRFKPDYYAAYNNLGVIHNRRGETQQSLEAYSKALSLDPTSSEARFNVGLIYVSTGERDKALREYLLLEKIDPGQAAKLLKFISYAGLIK